MYIKGIGRQSVDWTDLAQDRDRWQAAFNEIKYLPIA
jgi:hypothetical protein